MSGTPDMERILADWMASAAPSRAPTQPVEDAISTTRARRPRPMWLALLRTPPMSTPRSALVGSIPVRVAYLGMGALLALALAVGGIAAGASVLVRASDDEAALPPPFGPARNGLIAFDSLGDIWTVTPDGSDPRQLTSGTDLDFSPTWSPDGSKIAFWSIPEAIPADGAIEDFAPIATAALAEAASLVVIQADGSDPKTLATDVSLTRREALPHWAPDSSRLAFARDDLRGVPSIVAVNAATGAKILALGQGEDPVWSPDGKSIAYKGGLTSADYGVYVYEVGPDRSLRITTIDGGVGRLAFWEPQWAPETPSHRIAFYGPDLDIWRVDVARTEPVARGSERTIAADADAEYFPMWSPDGSRIAFVRVVDASRNAVEAVLVDPDGGNEVVLEHPPLVGVQLVWAPDGSMLMGSVPGDPDPSVTDEMLILDVTGSEEPRSISAVGQVGFASWQRLAQ
jgi:Tol biopolymer transport system component